MVRKIVLCDACKGAGKSEQSELTDYHHREYDCWDEPCGVCGGAGRMVEESSTRKLTNEELALRSRPPQEDR